MKRPTQKRSTELLPFAIFNAHNNTSLSLAGRSEAEGGERAEGEGGGEGSGGVWRASGVRGLEAFRDEPEAGSV